MIKADQSVSGRVELCFDKEFYNKRIRGYYNYNVKTFNPLGHYFQGQRVKIKGEDGKWYYGIAMPDGYTVRGGLRKYRFVADNEAEYNNSKDYEYKKYVKEMHDLIAEKNPGMPESTIYFNIAKEAPWEYKAKATWNYISNYNFFAQVGASQKFIYENSAINSGIDPEEAEIYGELSGDLWGQMTLESFATISGDGIKSLKALKNGESLYEGDVVAGSGIGNLVGKEKQGYEGGGNSNSIPDEFYKHNGGMDKADTISIHAEKHLYNPEVISTKKKTQFGKDIDILKLREDTMLHPDSIIYNDEQNVIKYVKEYDFNISTPDTPTGQHRVFINLSPKAGKTNRNSQFPLYTGGN